MLAQIHGVGVLSTMEGLELLELGRCMMASQELHDELSAYQSVTI